MSQLSLRDIDQTVCAVWGISEGQLRGKRQDNRFSRPRMAAFKFARTYTRKSLPAIGIHYQKNHTTVLHGLRRVPDLIVTSVEFAQRFQRATFFLESKIEPRATRTRDEAGERHWQLSGVAVMAEIAATWV